jgi:hypothetical protein
MMPRDMPPKPQPMWCDHCNADILPTGIRGCLRKTCATKALLDEREKGTNA